MIYDVDYFIAKFQAIPEDLWTTGELGKEGEPRCATGHCGVEFYSSLTEEAKALSEILRPVATKKFIYTEHWDAADVIWHVNDAWAERQRGDYRDGRRAKANTLAALHEAKLRKSEEYSSPKSDS